jgi:hypothetical protein
MNYKDSPTAHANYVGFGLVLLRNKSQSDVMVTFIAYNNCYLYKKNEFVGFP